jgi:hypothetical protein
MARCPNGTRKNKKTRICENKKIENKKNDSKQNPKSNSKISKTMEIKTMEINTLMTNYLSDFKKLQHITGSWNNVRRINKALNNNTEDSIFVNYLLEFKDLLISCSSENITYFYKTLKQKGGILFKDIEQFYNDFRTSSIPTTKKFNSKKNPTLKEKIVFLSYVFIVEVFVDSYIQRINEIVFDKIVDDGTEYVLK